MRLFAFALALAALSGSAMAQTPAKPCISANEAEGLVLVVLPEALRSAQQTCQPHLPANALLNQPSRLVGKYQAETEAAWPMALEAMGKIVDPQAKQLLQGEMGRAMLPAMIGPMIAGEIKPKDCGAINRMIELLEPLPARNTAGLFVTILQLAGQDKNRQDKLPICPFTAGR